MAYEEATLEAMLLQGCDTEKLNQLNQLSKEELVRLTCRLLDKTKEQVRQRYIINPSVTQDSVSSADVARAEAICTKWVPIGPDHSNGLCHHNISTSGLQLHWVGGEGGHFDLVIADHSLSNPTGDVMSSAMLLYRLCCLFDCTVEGRSGYANVWAIQLKHKATGECAGFSEHNGGAVLRVSKVPGVSGSMSDPFKKVWGNTAFGETFPPCLS